MVKWPQKCKFKEIAEKPQNSANNRGKRKFRQKTDEKKSSFIKGLHGKCELHKIAAKKGGICKNMEEKKKRANLVKE